MLLSKVVDNHMTDKKFHQSGEIAALITVLSAVVMIAGSLIGFNSADPNSTSSFASCKFNPKAFVKLQVGNDVVSLDASIEPEIADIQEWNIKNDRSQTTYLSFDSTGQKDTEAIDKEYCCGDSGFNVQEHHPERTYKMSSGEMAHVTLDYKDAKYTVVKKCAYDKDNPLNPTCVDVSPSDAESKTIKDLPIDCLKYSYGWIMKCEGAGCPEPDEETTTPTPTTHLYKECRAHFIIDNSSSINEFAALNKENIEKEINEYRQQPSHHNDTVTVNYQYFNKDVMPASPYVLTDNFKIDLIRENWTNIDAAMREAVEPQTPDVKTINFLFTDGKPTVFNTPAGQCTGSYEDKAISGCSPCLISDKQNCKSPYVIPLASCPANLKQACESLDYNRDFMGGLTKSKWVDYAVAMGDTPDMDLLAGVSKNAVIPVGELADKIAFILERECGLPTPTPGEERSGDNKEDLRQRADINNDGVVTALDVAVCLASPTNKKCDIVGTDGKINSLDRSLLIGLI